MSAAPKISASVEDFYRARWVEFLLMVHQACANAAKLTDRDAAALKDRAHMHRTRWPAPATRHKREGDVSAALPMMAFAFARQETITARVALAEPLSAWTARCAELLGVPLEAPERRERADLDG